jgi:hypothetical protein
LDTRRRYNRYSLSYNEKENEEDEDDEDEDDEDDEDEDDEDDEDDDENDDDDNSYSYGKREGVYRKNGITGKSNKMRKGKDKVGV